MTNIILSVTSHNNDDLIEQNFLNLPLRTKDFNIKVMVIDNTNSENLKKTCESKGTHYYSDNLIRGYGENNNKNFELADLSDNDIFIVCNPDITFKIDQLNDLFINIKQSNSDIYGVKVYESKDLKKFSSHNRSFPCLLDPIISFLFKKKLFVNDVNQYAKPDWIGGAFMAFKVSSYKKLNGFDKSYFMYYEDTDICHRAKNIDMTIIYNPNFYIIHDAKRAGRKLFSKFFLWNMRSMIKYFLKFPPKCIMGKNISGK